MADDMIYIALLDENVDVWRPVPCEQLPDGTYQLPDDQPETEAWEFPPGSRVRAEWRELADGRVLVASALVAHPR